RGVGQHGVDLAGLRREIGAGHRLAAVAARDVFQEPLELADVAVDGLLELAVAAILVADLLEGLLALHRVEAAGEDVALAALVAVPQLGGRVVIDHPRDVDGERVERLEAVAGRTIVTAGRRASSGSLVRADLGPRGAMQQLREPAVAAVARG